MFLKRLFILLLLPAMATEARTLNEELARHVKPADPIIWSGYVYGSYNYLVRSPYFTSYAYNRLNDIAQNGARLQQLYFSASQLGEGVGGYVDMLAGIDAYSLAPNGWNPAMFNLNTIGYVVPEAYLQYRFKGFTFKAGEMQSLAGLESYIYTHEASFSRSILDQYAVPGSHIGFRLVQMVSGTTQWFAGLGNGWSTIMQPGRQNAVEVGVLYDDEKTSLVVDGFICPMYMSDALNTGPTSTRGLFDIYGSYRLTKQVKLAFNADYGMQHTANLAGGRRGLAVWAGIAGYVYYHFSEKLATSVRGEVFNDPQGMRTGVRQNWKEATVTLSYAPVPHMDLVAEVRHDFSNVSAFVQSSRFGANNNQQSYSLSAMYTFT